LLVTRSLTTGENNENKNTGYTLKLPPFRFRPGLVHIIKMKRALLFHHDCHIGQYIYKKTSRMLFFCALQLVEGKHCHTE